MHKQRTTLVIGFVLLVLQPLLAQRPPEPRWNLLLISIDTLRADHVGAYGHPSVTPTLDRLAREGVVFEQVFTPVPLTLPSHTSLFTATYPPANGVRDNGEALSSSVPTLAEQMHAQAFQTAAFVGSFVLDRRFGLARGFDEYWGDFPLSRFSGAGPGEIQIRGDRVAEAAAKWIGLHASQRFFAFVHFYDLHGPYLLPQPWRTRFAGRLYDGELSYVDGLIGQLWQELVRRGVANNTLLVILSDHGEGLGDHGEQNHGFFLYRSTTHVPLIIRLPDRSHAGKRVETVARLIDVAPTVCALLGVPAPASFQGRNLAPAFKDELRTPLPAYSETLYPFRHFHTAPLYALRDQRYAFIRAPRSELYDTQVDRVQELDNLASTKPSMANSLRSELDSLMASMTRGPSAAPVTPELLERLKSLGYVGASTTGGLPPGDALLPDPKDRIPLYREFQQALALEMKGETQAAARHMESIAARDPSLVIVQIEAGLARQRLHEDEKAVKHFKAALKADPQNALAHYDLGISLGNLHQSSQAEQELDLAKRLQPWFSRAFTALGLSQARRGDLRAAVASLGGALAVDSNDFDALLNRGNVRFMLQDWEGGQADLERAAVVEPRRGEVRQALGTMYFHRGRLDRALEEYLEALKLMPRSSSLHSALGLLYVKLGRSAEASVQFRRALTLDPTNKEARSALQQTPR